ncbi:hypothetical protein PF003_g23307 [Phytophthora fragariae]|nr:hypothetical protein PF003_g23307 [Phytophthora fragariae]
MRGGGGPLGVGAPCAGVGPSDAFPQKEAVPQPSEADFQSESERSV